MPTSSPPLPDWPRFLGPPTVAGRLRAVPEDFRVWELPLIEPEGAGSHLWLEVRKRDANTEWVARQFAAAAGVHPRDVGYAGMKDRRAVTTQWFSIAVQEATRQDPFAWDIPGVEILRAARHGRKLQRGALRGNRFCIAVRDLTGERGELERRLAAVKRRGVPNYFGRQRFGRGGTNLARARRWLERGERVRRHQRSIYLSALRSYLFNCLLSERVTRNNWDRLIAGDVAMLDGSRATFGCGQPDAELQQRCDRFDIHPTGPLPGDRARPRVNRPGAAAAELEDEVLAPHRGVIDALARQGVEAGRRALRVLPMNLQWELGDAGMVLEFTLPPGAYATGLLRELVFTQPDTISAKG